MACDTSWDSKVMEETVRIVGLKQEKGELFLNVFRQL